MQYGFVFIVLCRAGAGAPVPGGPAQAVYRIQERQAWQGAFRNQVGQAGSPVLPAPVHPGG